MEHGQFGRESFMQDVRELTRDVVNRAREHARSSGERTFPDLAARCPRCQASPLKQDDRTFRCTQPDCGFVLWKVIAGRELQPNEAAQLLSSGMVGPLDGFRSRKGTPFSAALQLSDEAKVTFVASNEEDKEDEEGALTPENYVCDYTLGEETVGKIYEAPSAYVLDAAVLGNEKFRKVRLPKTLCRYRIPREQAVKFFTEGKTGLIEAFISKKGRPFKAHLVRDAEGRRFVNWEFPPRAAGKSAGRKRPAAKKRDVRTGAGRKTGSRGSAKKKSRKGSKSGARAVRPQALDEASNA
jgi:DNA topoisomerase-3